jgi:hypothetical protein
VRHPFTDLSNSHYYKTKQQLTDFTATPLDFSGVAAFEGLCENLAKAHSTDGCAILFHLYLFPDLIHPEDMVNLPKVVVCSDGLLLGLTELFS